MRFAFRPATASAVGVLTLGLMACAGQQPNPALEQARSRVSQVAQDPTVAQQAPLEVQRARQSLQVAESAYERNDEAEVVNHRAYIAAQQAAIARELAQARAAQEQIKNAEAERTRVLLEARERQAQGLQQQTQSLQRELQELQAKQTPRGTVVTLGNVLFKLDSAELVPGAEAQLERLAQFLRNHPEARAEIEGYTDSTGSDTYNLGLSQRRADTVRAALVRSGVDPSRVTARGFGEAAPIASNDTAAGRQMNRRVEVVVSGPGLSPQASGTVR